MYNYFLSENTKMKHTFLKKLNIIVPFFLCIFSAFINFNYYKVCCYNWWYISLLPGTLALSCVLFDRIDNSMKNKSILSLNVDLKKVWIAKILVCVKNLAVSCICIFIFLNIIAALIPIDNIIEVPFESGILAIIVLILTFMWQIPLTLFISEKIGLTATVIISIMINSISGVLAVKSYWNLNPFSYPARLMCPILNILPNGLLAVPESTTFTPDVLNYSSVPYGIVISLILFLVLTYLTTKRFERVEAV